MVDHLMPCPRGILVADQRGEMLAGVALQGEHADARDAHPAPGPYPRL